MSSKYPLPRAARGRCGIRSSFLLMARMLQSAVWVAAKPKRAVVLEGSLKKSRSGPSGWQAWKQKKALAASGETRVVVKQESPSPSPSPVPEHPSLPPLTDLPAIAPICFKIK